MKSYFPAFDSLRFFASVNIVLRHLSHSDLLSYAKGTSFEPIMEGPFFSTSVFFLLSGFIYSILFSEQERVPKLKSFMKERFWRLYPLHLICTLLIFAIILYRTHHLDNPTYAIKTLALHISLLWAFVPELGHSLNQPSWALSVFFLCYALTPALSKFLNRQNKKTLWFLFLGLWVISILFIIGFNKLPRVFSGINFFSGMLLGKLFSGNTIPLPKKAVLNDLFLLFSVVLLYVNVRYFRQVNPKIAYHIVSPILYSALLLFLANNKGFTVKILSVSWFRAIGKVSFYTYLLHCVVIQFLPHNLFNTLPGTIMILILLYGGCIVYKKFLSLPVTK